MTAAIPIPYVPGAASGINLQGTLKYDLDDLAMYAHRIEESFGPVKKLICADSSRVSEQGLLTLGNAFTQLTHLNLAGCFGITSQALLGFRRVIHLDISTWAPLAEDVVPLQSLTQLQSLEASGSYGGEDPDQAFEVFASLPNLQSLKILGTSNITERSLKHLYNGCTSLMELAIHFCRGAKLLPKHITKAWDTKLQTLILTAQEELDGSEKIDHDELPLCVDRQRSTITDIAYNLPRIVQPTAPTQSGSLVARWLTKQRSKQSSS